MEKKINKMSIAAYKTFLQKEDTRVLHKLKIHFDDLYYNTGEFTVEDDRYDMLKDILKIRDPGYTPPVGAKLRQGENRAKLPFWLGSLDKITPKEEDALKRFIKSNLAAGYVITEKLDGVSCLFISSKKGIKLYTRGNGLIGADISYLASHFKLNVPGTRDIVVRGELILKKKVFEKKYRGKTINGREYKNARNMVSGLIGGKTVRQGLEDIDFVTYEIVGDETMPKPSLQLQELAKLGFKTVENKTVKNISVNTLARLLQQFKASSQYEIDGITVQADEQYDRNPNGNPDYMIAFKMLSEESIRETTVQEVEWNVSKWGQLKPVVIVNPIQLNDITITRATAHNAKYVEENSLGPGAVIKITRSKDVIPYIVEVISGAEIPQMPKVPFSWDANHVNISVQKEDDTMCIKLISDFFAKLGIKQVSEATVGKMFKNGLDNLLKIVGASKERLLQVPEFKDRSAERIFINIKNGLQNIRISTLVGASGVLGFGIGRKRMDMLLLDIPDLLDIYKTKTKKQMIETIVKVDGFSDITAAKVVSNLKYAVLFVAKMKPFISLKIEKRISSTMKGEKYVMSGFRDKQLEEDIAGRGGKVVTSVSKNTTAIIVSDKSGKESSKVLAAKKLNVPVYEKEDFISEFIK